MPCFKPLRAYLGPGADGKQKVRFRPGIGLTPGELPCGQCIGCRVSHAKEWAMRIMHEASLYPVSQFVTLTYDDEHMPPGGSLSLRDCQLFFKRLRKAHGKLRYYLCGEYGETTWRPHYHAIVFGLALADLRVHRETNAGTLYTSASMAQLWGLGHVVIGNVTAQTAEYCARYVTKKLNGDAAKVAYERVDKKTGEVHKLRPPFAVMSRAPGLGAWWCDKFQSDVYPSDQVVLEGKVSGKPPRYYDKRIAGRDPLLIASMKAKRKAYAEEPRQIAESSTTRRRVRAEVLRARLSLRKREAS